MSKSHAVPVLAAANAQALKLMGWRIASRPSRGCWPQRKIVSTPRGFPADSPWASRSGAESSASVRATRRQVLHVCRGVTVRQFICPLF